MDLAEASSLLLFLRRQPRGDKKGLLLLPRRRLFSFIIYPPSPRSQGQCQGAKGEKKPFAHDWLCAGEEGEIFFLDIGGGNGDCTHEGKECSMYVGKQGGLKGTFFDGGIFSVLRSGS